MGGHVGAVSQALNYLLPEVGLVGLVVPLDVMHGVHHYGPGVDDDRLGAVVGDLQQPRDVTFIAGPDDSLAKFNQAKHKLSCAEFGN